MRTRAIIGLTLALGVLTVVAPTGRAANSLDPEQIAIDRTPPRSELRGRAGLVLAPGRPGLGAGAGQYAARPGRRALYRVAGQPGASDRCPRVRARVGEHPGRPGKPGAGFSPVQSDRGSRLL